MTPVGFEPTIAAGEQPWTYALGRGYIGARTDTTQQYGQTPDKEVYINDINCLCQGLH
jgi:trehalose/maltose hydrolase-like predicted phosphorylase